MYDQHNKFDRQHLFALLKKNLYSSNKQKFHPSPSHPAGNGGSGVAATGSTISR
jgi:hypothetical protein